MLTRFVVAAKPLVRRFQWRIIAAAILIAVIFIIIVSESFQTCIQANQEYQQGQSFTESLRIFIGIRWWCTGIFINGNGIAITAFATIAIAWFTFSLRDATKEQGRLTQQSIDLARAEFLATHHPRIIIRFVQEPVREPKTDQLYVWVTVVNIGPTEAEIIEVGSDLIFRKEFRPLNGLEAGLKPVTSTKLVSGQRYVITARLRPDESDNSVQFWNEFIAIGQSDRKIELCVVGGVQYRDGNGVTREMGFFRVYDPKRKCWRPDEESECDYED